MGSIMNSIKTGFGLGTGFQPSVILFMLVGFLFFIPGYVLFKKEQDAGRRGSTTLIFGVVLMGIGVVIMGGFGFSMLMDGIKQI
jgi:hypothetical protein